MYSIVRRIIPSIGKTRKVSSFVKAIETSVLDLPHREAVRYTDKNVKWTAEVLNKLSDDHAGTLVDIGFKKGDPILNWMPEGREKHISLLAAAKIGLVVTELDANLDSVQEIRKALFASQPKLIVFDPEFGLNRLELLRQSIPEFYHYDDEDGHEFHSKYFPKLKYFLHTGYDLEVGCHNFKRWMTDSPEKPHLVEAAAQITDDLPLYRSVVFNNGNLEVSPVYTQKEVFEQKKWQWADNLIQKVYFEV
mmetsp:Transcript_6626/g.6933  ORF Transcript_6626/g.6933 Transcript_6626/m.6933 type:complete len:249 (-) Transcript_6626:100-846(-)